MDVHVNYLPIEGIGRVRVSTSDIDYICPPETCLFWPGDSVVVERYVSWPQAVQGHVAWTADAARVSKAIMEHRRHCA